MNIQHPKHIRGDSVKAISDNRVAGYLVRFTNAEDTDLHGEYFDKDTDFWTERGYPIKGAPILIEHGFDDAFKVMPVGVLDFVDERDAGIWVEGKLHDREEYREMLRKMRNTKKLDWDDERINRQADLIAKTVKAFFATGEVQWSSGALPQSVEVDDRHIKSWAIIEGTGTMTPAEADGTEISILKSAFQDLHDFLNQQTDSPTGHKEATGSKDDTGASTDIEPMPQVKEAIVNDSDEIPAKEDTAMDENMIRQIVRMVLEEANNVRMDDEEEMDEEEAMQAVASDVEKMEDDMDEEEKAKTVAEKTWQYVQDKMNAREKMLEAAQQVSKSRMEALKREPAKSGLPAYTGNGNGNGNGHLPQIQMKSNFDHWTPADFSFAASVAAMTRGTNRHLPFNPDQKFYREFADKAERAYKNGSFHLNPQGVKAINAIKADELDYSTQSGFGDEWVFTAWSDNVWDKPRLDNVVVGLLENIEMPSNPYEYPVESTDPTVFAVGETADENQLARNDANTAIPDSKIATAKVQISASKHALRVTISAELEEDGIARLMPKFREQAERTIQDAHENVVVNGDTSTSGNINLDGGTPTTQNYTSYDGLIHQALVSATTNRVDASGANPTLAHIRQIRGLLGNAQGYNPRNLAIITDFPTYMKLLDIDAVLTMDKYGSNATVMTGELGRIDGIPVFVSGQLALADTDGKITDGGNVTDTGRLLMVYRPDWFVGFRRRVVQHLNFLPFADAWELVMTVRHGLAARSYSAAGAQQSSDDSVSLLYNIGV